jgi:hypothetical protein
MSLQRKKKVSPQSQNHTLYGENLYKLGLDGIFQQCLSPTEGNVILIKLHDGPRRGHYGISTTIKTILTFRLLVADNSMRHGRIMLIL